MISSKLEKGKQFDYLYGNLIVKKLGPKWNQKGTGYQIQWGQAVLTKSNGLELVILRNVPVSQLGQGKIKSSNIYKADHSFQQFLKIESNIAL